MHGAVELDAGRIFEEVVTHLVGLVGAKLRVTLEIEAEIPRIVTENARTLKFTSQGFEETEGGRREPRPLSASGR